MTTPSDDQLKISLLTANLRIANDQAEHFEREWYLRGDEIERLRAKLAEVERQRDNWNESTDELLIQRDDLRQRAEQAEREVAHVTSVLADYRGSFTLQKERAEQAEKQAREFAERNSFYERLFPVCKTCGGQGAYWDGPPDDPQERQCEDCYTTGVDQSYVHKLEQAERERDELRERLTRIGRTMNEVEDAARHKALNDLADWLHTQSKNASASSYGEKCQFAHETIRMFLRDQTAGSAATNGEGK